MSAVDGTGLSSREVIENGAEAMWIVVCSSQSMFIAKSNGVIKICHCFV